MRIYLYYCIKLIGIFNNGCNYAGRIVGKGRVYTNDLWRFSLKDYVWEKIDAKNVPSARHNITGVQYNNKWIIFGGQDASGIILISLLV